MTHPWHISPIRKYPIDTLVLDWHDRAMHNPPVTEEALREAIEAAGSPEKAAPVLGVSRRTVYRWMERYGIKRRVVLDRAA